MQTLKQVVAGYKGKVALLHLECPGIDGTPACTGWIHAACARRGDAAKATVPAAVVGVPLTCMSDARLHAALQLEPCAICGEAGK